MPGLYFVVTRTLGINTDPFRDLRVGSGEGLGGAARETGHPIRSLNYEEDRNLRAAKREETRGEGINSALAVPVRDGGNVEAVLYVASRRPRAYSEDDERVLADFANAALRGLDRSNLGESRRGSFETWNAPGSRNHSTTIWYVGWPRSVRSRGTRIPVDR
ncbi:GAF domain-containing protein [Rhodococcus sp. NPDC057529]|uniref:GAF domain-containing protein n=1 Tax=Rhodococcus sp. NPDC057529 TaxID=3346158 RepID=UPI003671ABE7